MNDRLAFDLFGRGRDVENGIVQPQAYSPGLTGRLLMVQPIRQQMTEAVAAAERKRSVNSTHTYVR